jgi:hypothetical protein
MSFAIFEIEKFILETEIAKYRKFLMENFRLHEIRQPNFEILNGYKNKVQEYLKENRNENIEDQMKYILMPGWKSVFDADNVIDTDNSLEKQKQILEYTLKTLESSQKIDTTYFSQEIVDTINGIFLSDSTKLYVLQALLKTEHALCNENITILDALCERVRVMYYSGMMVCDINKVEDVVDFINKKENKKILPSYIVNILKLPYINNLVSVNQLSIVDLLHLAAFAGIICGPSDDYMDLKEDIENNKITGITQCVKENVDPKIAVSATITFLINSLDDKILSNDVRTWCTEVMIFLYHDIKGCLKFCREVSPELFDTVFQRVGRSHGID